MSDDTARPVPWWLRLLVWLGTTVAVVVGLLLLGAGYTALQPQTEHESCTVSEVTFNPAGRRSFSSLTVESDCGTLTAPSLYRPLLKEGETYGFTVRGFGWETPTITDVRAPSASFDIGGGSRAGTTDITTSFNDV